MPRSRCLKIFLLLLVIVSSALAGSDPVDLFKRHRYEEAATLWERDIKSEPLDEKGVRSLKGLSMAFHQLGSLYNRLHLFSLAVSAEYYKGVFSEAKSALGLYYFGQVLYQNGSYDSAASSFDKAGKLGGTVIPEENEVFLSFAKDHGKTTGTSLANLKTNAAKWQLLDLSGADASAIPGDLKASSPRARRCRLSILARSSPIKVDEIHKALLAVIQDAENPEVSQDPGRNTQLNFYDPFVLETLSRAYAAISQGWQVRLLEEEKRFPGLQRKFATPRNLAETCLLRGQYSQALQYLGSDDNDVLNRIMKAKILGKMGKVAEARTLLDGVAADAKTPEILRELAESYYFLAIDFQKGLHLAKRALEDKDGTNYYRISAALLLATGKNDASLQEYAKGYKIEFRNRIDQIDPEYMADYSFAIFLTNKMRYEEVVETLFYLQKELPACRQMYYAMQGVSAGVARNYETQRIFRKGG